MKDPDSVNTLLDIFSKTQGHPSLQAINRAAMVELEKINEKLVVPVVASSQPGQPVDQQQAPVVIKAQEEPVEMERRV